MLEEIEEERQKKVFSVDTELENANDDSGIILVACKDERSCMQLEEFIEKGSQKVCSVMYVFYLVYVTSYASHSRDSLSPHSYQHTHTFLCADVVPVLWYIFVIYDDVFSCTYLVLHLYVP